DRGARDQLVRLAGILDRWRDIAEIYQGYLDETLTPGPAWSAVCWTLAGLYDEKLGDVDRAKECYERLAEANPDDRMVFDSLERSLVRARRSRDLLDLYEQRLSRESELGGRRALLVKMADVYENSLKDEDEAIST